MNQNATPAIRPSLLERAWHMPSVKAYLALAMLATFLMPGSAFAQSAGGGTFGGISSKIAAVFCDFIKSPIITVFVGVAMLGLFVVAAMNEDNKMLSTILKVIVAGLAIVFLPGLLEMLGFSRIC